MQNIANDTARLTSASLDATSIGIGGPTGCGAGDAPVPGVSAIVG